MMDDAWARRPEETGPAWEAFRLYRELRRERSLSRVARELGKTMRLMEGWSARHEWVARARAFDDMEEELKREASNKAITDMVEFHVRSVRASFQAITLPTQALLRRYQADPERFMEELSGRPAVELIKLVRDLAGPMTQLASFERLSRGEPTEVTRAESMNLEMEVPDDDDRLAAVIDILRGTGALPGGAAGALPAPDAADDELHPAPPDP